jgi:pSer/pThr/pTyr-binding forkhead associated (FHA) protein
MYKLIIEDDEGKTTEVPIIRDEITVGRKEGNTIRLTERNVSRRHARITRQGNGLFIEDLLSYNGIKVNGDRIQGKVAVGDGDRVQIGDYQVSVKLDKGGAKVQMSGQGPQTTPINRAEPTLMTGAVQSPQATMPQPVQAPVVKVPEKPARLIVVSTNFARQEFQLEKATVVIGRTDDNDVVLNHRSISRHHAKIVREGDKFQIMDMQSANGVRVNGEEYGKVELRKGDKIDLGHVRLVFVPPGQDIPKEQIDAMIVDRDQRGTPVIPILLTLVLLAAVGGGAYWFLTQSPKVDVDAEAAKTLVDVESDLSSKRWQDVLDKTGRIVSNTAIAIRTRDAAQTKRAIAEKESKNKQIYDRFAGAAGSGNYDAALKTYREIPEDSVYQKSAKEDYDKIFPLFVESHLKLASDARAAGNCSEARSQVQLVLDVDPKQVRALAAKDQSCSGSSGSSSSNSDNGSSSKDHRHKDKDKPKVADGDKPDKPEKTEKPEKPEKTEKPDKTEKVEAPPAGADPEQVLTDAQSEFVNGNYDKAISLARSVAKVSTNRAWRIIGAAACRNKDLKLVGDAYRKLDNAARQYLIYVCQREGIVQNGNQFKQAE